MKQTDYTGRTLGGYRILRKLGQGGMAVVYKAHEESLNRVVALKVIAQHLAEDEQFIARFQREAQAAAQLNHPNIVGIFAIGEDDGVHYFSMEFVKGRSLAEIIQEEGFLTAGRAVPIIAQAAEALTVAHDAGIVHRDIKPANIMIDGSGRVKVADFGIAQMATATRMTQSGMLVGTPEFISPEQCRGEKLDGRSDIYSLGVTLYQLLSGRTPFNADTPAGLVFQIVEGPIQRVDELNPTVPPSVQEIVAKMMHKDRNQRFQSAEDLVDALRRADTSPVTSGARPHPVPAVAEGGQGSADPADPTVAMPSKDSPGGRQAATVAMDDSSPAATKPTGPEPTGTVAARAGAATEAMPGGKPRAPTEALPATEPEGPATAAEADLPPTKAMPTTDRDAAGGGRPAAAAATGAAAGRPSPATQARARSDGNNRGALLGLAAGVLILLTVLIVAWQFMGDSGADEPFDPIAEARPQAGPGTGDDAAAGTAETTNEAGGEETTGDAQSTATTDAGAGSPTGTEAGGPAGTTAAGGTQTDDAPTGDRGAATDTTGGATPPANRPEREPAALDPPPASGTGAVSGTVTGNDPQAAAIEEPTAPAPAPNTVVAETSGEYENVEQIHAWLERAFTDQDFDVIDLAASPYASAPEAARYQLVTTARLAGSEQLEYFGNRTTQYTVSLSSRVVDLSNGRTVVGPEVETIKYTSINSQQNLERGTTNLARRMARELRQLIR